MSVELRRARENRPTPSTQNGKKHDLGCTMNPALECFVFYAKSTRRRHMVGRSGTLPPVFVCVRALSKSMKRASLIRMQCRGIRRRTHSCKISGRPPIPPSHSLLWKRHSHPCTFWCRGGLHTSPTLNLYLIFYLSWG